MGSQNQWVWEDDFYGPRTFAEDLIDSAGKWVNVEVAAAGTPTYVIQDQGEGLAVNFDAQNEIQNLSFSFGDSLQWPIDYFRRIFFRMKMGQAALDATTMFAFGVCGDRNAAIDSIAQQCLFRVIGADDTAAIVVESDDGTTDRNGIATGKSLSNAFVDFEINFALGLSDVRFFIGGQPVAEGTTFDMSGYAGGYLQPLMQIQKTADTNTDGFVVRKVRAEGIYPISAAL